MKIWDIIVIGAGASGLMAAGKAAELGANVLLLEKNKQPGIKLLMSGGGRCNFTNHSSSVNLFASVLGINGKWLLSALNCFGPQEVINFFEDRDVVTKIEDNNRVFPVTDKAQDILKALLDYNRNGGVQIKTEISVKDIVLDNNNIIEKVVLADGGEFRAKQYIIATGGCSYPSSGSNGDAYTWLQSLGHSLIKPKPSLSQIYIQNYPLFLEGLSLDLVSLQLIQDKKKIASERGPILFTSKGVSGPAAINLSRYINSLLDKKLKIDFLPEIKNEEFDLKIRELISKYPRYNLKNILTGFAPKRLLEYLLKEIDLSGDLKSGELTRLQRLSLVEVFKNYSFNINGIGDFTEAMVTRGGLNLKEVDGRTMKSKLISNLYVSGECLDLDGPTGGYNLQIAWSTGFVAGKSAAMKLEK